MNNPIHSWSIEELLAKFTPLQAIVEFVISCAENDVSLSQQDIEEKLNQLEELNE